MDITDFWFALGMAADSGVLFAGFGLMAREHFRRVGGLLFFRIGRFGGSVYLAKES